MMWSSFLLAVIVLFASYQPIYAFERESEDVLCFLFFSLFVGTVFTYVISRYAPEVHYTVVLFIAGILFAISFNDVGDDDLLATSIDSWEGFDADLILYLFLPALLFSEAMNLNFHNVKTNFIGALLLAGPGAIIACLLAALFTKYCLPYNWNWNLSLVFGAITCATDPVGKCYHMIFPNLTNIFVFQPLSLF